MSFVIPFENIYSVVHAISRSIAHVQCTGHEQLRYCHIVLRNSEVCCRTLRPDSHKSDHPGRAEAIHTGAAVIPEWRVCDRRSTGPLTDTRAILTNASARSSELCAFEGQIPYTGNTWKTASRNAVTYFIAPSQFGVKRLILCGFLIRR